MIVVRLPNLSLIGGRPSVRALDLSPAVGQPPEPTLWMMTEHSVGSSALRLWGMLRVSERRITVQLRDVSYEDDLDDERRTFRPPTSRGRCRFHWACTNSRLRSQALWTAIS